MNQKELDKLRDLINRSSGREELESWLNHQYWLLFALMPGSEEDQYHYVKQDVPDNQH